MINKNISKWDIFFFLCGIVMLVSELIKQWCLTYLVNSGKYDWWYFPFQLCSIPMYLLLILPWIKKTRLKKVLLTYLMCFCPLGGIAVLADTSGLAYPLVYLTVHSYLWHFMLIVIGICACLAYHSEYSLSTLEYRLFLDCCGLYLGLALMASLMNLICAPFGMINMFYINSRYKMQQIGFSALIPYIGNTGAILVYMTLTVAGSFLIFLFWRLFRKR